MHVTVCACVHAFVCVFVYRVCGLCMYFFFHQSVFWYVFIFMSRRATLPDEANCSVFWVYHYEGYINKTGSIFTTQGLKVIYQRNLDPFEIYI